MALSPTSLSAGLQAARQRFAARARCAAAAAVGLVAVLVAGPCVATVYKCLRDDGQPFYQDGPCPPGRELRNFDVDPANVSVVPFTVPPTADKPRPAKPPKAARAPAAAGGAKSRKQAQPPGDAAQRRFLRPGMSEGEVIARVGPPDMTATRNRKSARWTYMPVPEDRDTITNITFENGRVAEVERKIIK